MIGKDQEIHKFDGPNFALWKNKMRHVLIQRRQLRLLSGEAKRPEGMINDNREELDLLAMSTIRLFHALVEKIYLTKKLYDLRMEDTHNVASHLNDIDAL